MRKYIAAPLTCALAMMALTGCTDPSTLYENNDLVAQGTTSYKAAEWSQSSLTDEGTIDYAAGAVSLTGAKEAFSFTMHADSANLDVYDTITCDTGACKILIVDTDTKSVAAEYTETAYDTIKLNGGNYTVYLVGKDDASFTTTLSLYSLGGDITWLLDEDTAAKTGKCYILPLRKSQNQRIFSKILLRKCANCR